MVNDPRELLSSALSLWWLRPENALAIASYVHNGYDFAPSTEQRAADYACGDGVNSFFKLGGRFDMSFDVFGVAVRGDSAEDVVKNNIDVFDHYDDSYAPIILKPADARFTYGMDHKPNLLRKARKLDFYDELIEGDLAQDTSIPDESLDIAYCNSLYWIAEPELAISHINRKLKNGGIAVYDVMTTHRKALQYQHWMPTMPAIWQDMMNRGRDANNPGIRSARDWHAVFESDGTATVEEVRDIFPAAIAYAWNIGLRPIFPVLNRMVESISTETRQSIKAEWVETWTELLLPLLTEPEEFSKAPTRARLQYIVRKH